MPNQRPAYIAMTDGPFFMTPTVPHSFPKVIDGHKDLKKACARYSSSMLCDVWENDLEICRHALFCFGDFNRWIDYHLNQVALSDWCFAFLEDTIRFIRTGQRRYSVHSLESFIRPDTDVQVSNELRKNRLKSLSEFWSAKDNPMPDNYIGLWCSHENGLRDLVSTLSVLFTGRRVQAV